MNHLALPIAITSALPFLTTLIAKSRVFSPAHNRRTRQWQGELTGWRQRAHWAHQNAFETLPIYCAAAILAHLAAPGSATAVAAVWAYPALRVALGAA